MGANFVKLGVFPIFLRFVSRALRRARPDFGSALPNPPSPTCVPARGQVPLLHFGPRHRIKPRKPLHVLRSCSAGHLSAKVPDQSAPPTRQPAPSAQCGAHSSSGVQRAEAHPLASPLPSALGFPATRQDATALTSAPANCATGRQAGCPARKAPTLEGALLQEHRPMPTARSKAEFRSAAVQGRYGRLLRSAQLYVPGFRLVRPVTVENNLRASIERPALKTDPRVRAINGSKPS